jgi:hypothetical protein
VTVWRELRRLAWLQGSDGELQGVRQHASTGDSSISDRCFPHQDIPYGKNKKGQQYRTACDPAKICNDFVRSFNQRLDTHWLTCAYYRSCFPYKGLCRKMLKVWAYCDTCQRVEFPNRKCDIEIRFHSTSAPGELLTVNLYGHLPVGRGGTRFNSCIWARIASTLGRIRAVLVPRRRACERSH